jgi:hypothetical protein
MTTFLFVYRAPHGHSFEPAMASDWSDWFKSMGSHIKDGGNPIYNRSVVGTGPTGTVLHGYSFIDADDLQSAVALAQGCPFIKLGGGVEVGEVTPLTGDGTTAGEVGEQVAT